MLRVDLDARTPQKALLIPTDAWAKPAIYYRFLGNSPLAVWRTRGRLTAGYLEKLEFPFPIYFFYRSTVGYRGSCLLMSKQDHWGIRAVPEEFQGDLTPYTLFIAISQLHPIVPVALSEFQKWRACQKTYSRGQQGLMWAVDPVSLMLPR